MAAKNNIKAGNGSFDLKIEAEKLYADFPQMLEFYRFIDVTTQQVVAPTDASKKSTEKLLKEPVRPLETLDDFVRSDERLSEKVAMHQKYKMNAVVHASGIKAVLLYMQDDQTRYLGKDMPQIYEQTFNFDHESAHAINRYGSSFGNSSTVVRESFADCYASLRHWQRFGLDTGAVENLIIERLKYAMFKLGHNKNHDLEHFTSPALEYLLTLRDKIDIDVLTPEETVHIAIEAAKYAPHQAYIEHLKKELFDPAAGVDRQTKDFMLNVTRTIADVVFTTKMPDIFNWSSKILSRLLSNMKVEGEEWDNMREKLADKRALYDKDPALFGIPMNKRRIVKMQMEFNNAALILVDVERKFCDPAAGAFGTEETDSVAKKISQLVQEFQHAGQPVVFVHTSDKPEFHYIHPGKNDFVYKKKKESAWDTKYKDISRHIDSLLKHHGFTSLLIAGFNTSACVKETARDAQKHGFDVTVLTDLCANDKAPVPWTEAPEKVFNGLRERGVTCKTLSQYRTEVARHG